MMGTLRWDRNTDSEIKSGFAFRDMFRLLNTTSPICSAELLDN